MFFFVCVFFSGLFDWIILGYGLKVVILLYQLDVKVVYSCQNEWHYKWYKEVFMGEWVNEWSA